MSTFTFSQTMPATAIDPTATTVAPVARKGENVPLVTEEQLREFAERKEAEAAKEEARERDFRARQNARLARREELAAQEERRKAFLLYAVIAIALVASMAWAILSAVNAETEEALASSAAIAASEVATPSPASWDLEGVVAAAGGNNFEVTSGDRGREISWDLEEYHFSVQPSYDTLKITRRSGALGWLFAEQVGEWHPLAKANAEGVAPRTVSQWGIGNGIAISDAMATEIINQLEAFGPSADRA